MEAKTYSIGEISEKTGVTVRTLHYYDEIGLLKPEKHPTSGHRQYSERDILSLHKIISLKFLGLSLDDIREILQKPTIDLSIKETLQFERELLKKKKEQIERSLNAIEHTLEILDDEGEIDSDILMSLLRSIQTEEEQKEWMEQYYDQHLIDILYGSMKTEEKKKQAEKIVVQFAKRVKTLYGKPIEDEEVQLVIDEYLKSTFQLLGIDQMQIFQPIINLENINIEELERLTPSPFSKEEENWLAEAMDCYMIRHGFQTMESDPVDYDK